MDSLPRAGDYRGDGRREKVIIEKAEVEGARKEIMANLEAAAAPTYLIESVTSIARKERDEGAERRQEQDSLYARARRKPGAGLRWGRIIHQVLEAVGSGRLGIPPVGIEGKRESPLADPSFGKGERDRAKLELFIENIIAAEESAFSDKERLIEHVEAVLSSPFWTRVMKAEKRYFEIPFSIKTDKAGLEVAGGLSAGISNIPVILNGTIDLVFRELGQDGNAAGWVIADYKTDPIRPQLEEEDIAELMRIYAPQIRLYAHFWKQITGEPVIESGLYFTSVDRWVSIPAG
jgi:ATP-dependent helicase/nuclease subunit A